MAWRPTGSKPLLEPISIQFTDANMQHYGEMRKFSIVWFNEIKRIHIYGHHNSLSTYNFAQLGFTHLYE